MIRFIYWGTFFLFLFSLISCDKDNDSLDPGKSSQNQYRRTVLVYAVAQNDLGYSYNRVSNFQSDSTEMLAGCQYLNEDENLLLFVDDASNPRIYRFTKGAKKPAVVRRWSKDVCSSSPEVLRDVLKWTQQYYPADEYGLVMWSHADGWLPAVNKDYSTRTTRSFGIDVGDDGKMSSNLTSDYKIGAQMDIHDMASAIENSGVHLKYIFFDACLMQNLETCYDLKEVTDYVVASPISIPANGANYTSQIRNGLFSDDVGNIAETYLQDVTDPLQVADYDDFGIVFSVVNTSYMDELASAVSRVLPFSALMNKNSVELNGVLTYHTYSSNYHYRPHQYDAQEAMEALLPPAKYEELKTIMDKLVAKKVATKEFWVGPGSFTYQKVDSSSFSGVAMFIPQQIYSANAKYTRHGDLNIAFKETAWYRDAGWSVTGW